MCELKIRPGIWSVHTGGWNLQTMGVEVDSKIKMSPQLENSAQFKPHVCKFQAHMHKLQQLFVNFKGMCQTPHDCVQFQPPKFMFLLILISFYSFMLTYSSQKRF